MARELSGTGQYFSLASGLSIGANTSIWMSAWIWVDSLATQQGIFVLGVSGSADNRRALFIEATTGKVAAMSTVTSGLVSALSPTGITPGAWFNIVGEWPSSTLRAASHSGGTRGTEASSRFLGAAPNHVRFATSTPTVSTALLDGKIAYAAIWTGAPTDTDRANLASGVHPMSVQPGSIVECWEFPGTTSPEPGLLGNALTITGSPTETDGPAVTGYSTAAMQPRVMIVL